MYQVIARKYRPAKFEELISQEHVRTTLALWVLPLAPERPQMPLKAVPLHQTRFSEYFPRFSPDGQWVA